MGNIIPPVLDSIREEGHGGLLVLFCGDEHDAAGKARGRLQTAERGGGIGRGTRVYHGEKVVGESGREGPLVAVRHLSTCGKRTSGLRSVAIYAPAAHAVCGPSGLAVRQQEADALQPP